MKDEPTTEAPDPAPPPRRPLALTPRPLAPGVEVRPFPGFGPRPEGPKLDVAGPSVAGEGGLLRAAGTFGCSALAGLLLTSFSVVTTRTAGAPRGARLERDARLRAQAVQLRDAVREAEEGPRARVDDAR